MGGNKEKNGRGTEKMGFIPVPRRR